MSRDINASTQAEFEKPRLCPIFMVELIFDDGPFRMWTGWGELRWGAAGTAWSDGTNWSDGTAWTDSETSLSVWYGAGEIGTIGRIEETIEGRAVGLDMSVGLTNQAGSGLPMEVIDYALSEDYQGRTGRVYFAALSDQGQLFGEPLLVFEGFMDQLSIVAGTQNGIRLTLESKAYTNELAANRRYTDEDQQSRYPGDRFNSYAGSLGTIREIPWGRAI